MCILSTHLQVSADEPLMAAGLDSLGSVELRNTLESSLAVTLPPTLVMDYPTAAAIAAYAASKLPTQQLDDAYNDISVADQGPDSPGPLQPNVAPSWPAMPVLGITALCTR